MSSGNGEKGRTTVRRLLQMKREGERIVALTAYDALFARLVDEAGADLILVGDSLGQVVLGYDSTVPVTLEEMLHHGAAVRRGAPEAFVVLDLPFLTYQVTPDEAVRNAGRALKEAGVQAVKMEGGSERILAAVRASVDSGIPVMGHLGLTPQSIHSLGGYRVQGREADEAERIFTQARALEEAGCFALVLELLPTALAARITAELSIPTIGIGAGPECDGQILVTQDLLGLNPDFTPRFLKRYAELWEGGAEALARFAGEVRSGDFPDREHSFGSEP